MLKDCDVNEVKKFIAVIRKLDLRDRALLLSNATVLLARKELEKKGAK